MADDQRGKMLAALLAGKALPQNALSRSEVPRNALMNALYPPPQARTAYLPPDQEAQYRAWMLSIGQAPGSGYNVDSSWNGTDYDYRGFFTKYGPADIRNGQHFTDEFKLPNHPTFSNESTYALGRAAPYAGSWEGNTFMPSPLGLLRGKRKFTE